MNIMSKKCECWCIMCTIAQNIVNGPGPGRAPAAAPLDRRGEERIDKQSSTCQTPAVYLLCFGVKGSMVGQPAARLDANLESL